ncbi:MAG TPA: hypothetical protein VHF69_06890 [Candidatus Synoicihabitans sp.]|nr:hypothetical protein [Candidatus Synoicihabitans sp.]
MTHVPSFSRALGIALLTPLLAVAQSRIINVSARAVAGPNEKRLIVGFVLHGGTGTTPVLLRAAGPSLAEPPFNVPGTVADPQLSLFAAGGLVISLNDDWGNPPSQVATLGEVMARVGAFPFTNNAGKDAAIYHTGLAARDYSAHVIASPAPGVALAEFYDAGDRDDAPRFINISTRADVGTGANVLIVGFYIRGAGTKSVLVRAVGPVLARDPYNIPGTLADPRLELHGSQGLLESNDNWGDRPDAATLPQVMVQAGAFPLTAGSKDAVLLASLSEGLYSVVISGVGNTTGVALAEVYELQ